MPGLAQQTLGLLNGEAIGHARDVIQHDPGQFGLILGGNAEASLNQALQLWGYSFFLRPLSLVLIAMIVSLLGYAIYRNTGSRRTAVQFGD